MGRMDWDSEVDVEKSEFTLLPEGEADFEVLKFERKTSNAKSCPMAAYTLRLSNEHGKTQTVEHILLHTDFAWKATEFFGAIGQISDGAEKFKPNWNCVGAKGRCRIKIERYIGEKDGKERKSNKVERFLVPDTVGDGF